MGKLDSYGTKAGMKDGPRSMNPERHGGKPDSFGASAPLKTTPSSNLPGNKSSAGSFDSFGTQASLDKSPRKGYESASTPMSKRSIEQSK